MIRCSRLFASSAQRDAEGQTGVRPGSDRGQNGVRPQTFWQVLRTGAFLVPRSARPRFRKPVVAYGDEPLRVLVFRMAETGVTRLPVVTRRDGTLIGMIALSDLLTARARILDAEQRRERVLGSRLRLRVFGRSESAA